MIIECAVMQRPPNKTVIVASISEECIHEMIITEIEVDTESILIPPFPRVAHHGLISVAQFRSMPKGVAISRYEYTEDGYDNTLMRCSVIEACKKKKDSSNTGTLPDRFSLNIEKQGERYVCVGP
jgi:hypothetical protein